MTTSSILYRFILNFHSNTYVQISGINAQMPFLASLWQNRANFSAVFLVSNSILCSVKILKSDEISSTSVHNWPSCHNVMLLRLMHFLLKYISAQKQTKQSELHSIDICAYYGLM